MVASARHHRACETSAQPRPRTPLVKRRGLLLLAAVLETAWIVALVILAMR